MKVKRREIIELTEKEDCAFQVISDGLEDIIIDTQDPALIKDATNLNAMLVQFYKDWCQEDII